MNHKALFGKINKFKRDDYIERNNEKFHRLF